VPTTVPVIDLAIVYGYPSFLDVLDPILAEVSVEAAWMSHDVVTANPETFRALTTRQLPIELIDHPDFKLRIGSCAFVVRSGEATPYANVLLRAGVPWLAAESAIADT
jgi:D-ribose pyranase